MEDETKSNLDLRNFMNDPIIRDEELQDRNKANFRYRDNSSRNTNQINRRLSEQYANLFANETLKTAGKVYEEQQKFLR